MEQKNINILWLIVSLVFICFSILPFFIGFLGMPRDGYCSFLDIFDWFRIIATSFILLSLYFSVKALRKSKKLVKVLSVISLLISLILFSFSTFVYFINIFNIGCTAKDVAIKADLSGLKLIGKNDKSDFGEYCSRDGIEKIKKGVEQNESKLICNNNNQEWAGCAQLIRGVFNPEYYCVDSTGESLNIKGICSENWKYTRCPEN
jgi:hypothetical protein